MTEGIPHWRGVLAGGGSGGLRTAGGSAGPRVLAAFSPPWRPPDRDHRPGRKPCTPARPSIAATAAGVDLAAFAIEEISRYDDRGPAGYPFRFSCGEHHSISTPIHTWITGQDLPDGATDTLPPARMIAPACVIVVRHKQRRTNALFSNRSTSWSEARYGRIPAGSWVLMRTDWSSAPIRPPSSTCARGRAACAGAERGGGAAAAGARRERLGIRKRVGTDYGGPSLSNRPSQHMPCCMARTNYRLASLTDLDRLPPTGAALITPPLKIRGGSGSPLRVLALVEQLKQQRRLPCPSSLPGARSSPARRGCWPSAYRSRRWRKRRAGRAHHRLPGGCADLGSQRAHPGGRTIPLQIHFRPAALDRTPDTSPRPAW